MKDFDNLYYSISDARKDLFKMLTDLQDDLSSEHIQRVDLIKSQLLDHFERITMFAEAFDPHE